MNYINSFNWIFYRINFSPEKTNVTIPLDLVNTQYEEEMEDINDKDLQNTHNLIESTSLKEMLNYQPNNQETIDHEDPSMNMMLNKDLKTFSGDSIGTL